VAITGEVIMVMAIMVAPAMVTMAADMVMAIDLGMVTGRAIRDAAMRVAATMAMLPAVSMVVAACTAVVATDKQRSLAGARG